MENESLAAKRQLSILQRLPSAVVPVLFIAIGYVDPGKYAAAIEGGAHYGYDLVVLMLVFNCAAILCQYLSVRIAVVTGRDLASICSEEYDSFTCMFLGVQVELSMIALDLAMILGTAHGLNLLLGLDLLTCVFLTTVDAILFPLFSSCLENGKGKLLCIYLASFILLAYVFGVLISQPEIPLSMGGMLSKLSGESALALMSLLGASIMPHNFYLHSSIVQQDLGATNVSKGTLCQDHFIAILCIYSGIFLVNYVLMNSAANVFYRTGLVLLTFQDALSLMDQVLRSLLMPVFFLLILLVSNHITALTWNLGGQVVLHNFFGMDIPGWLHHVTVRVIAVVPAFYCVWSSGAEGLYQLLIFTQILVALLLPSAVIPLFRVASSRSIMGIYKISQFSVILVVITFIGMLGLEIVFAIEMIFGNSDWASNWRWSMSSSTSGVYVLLIAVIVSLCLMLSLAATPLKSVNSKVDAQTWNRGTQTSTVIEENDFSENSYWLYESKQSQEPMLAFKKSSGIHPDMLVSSPASDLPEKLFASDSGPHLTIVEESCLDSTILGTSIGHPETVEIVRCSAVFDEISDGQSLESSTLKTEVVEGDLHSKMVNESQSSPSLTSEGPGSYRSPSGKSDDSGNGPASLSRLAGLGRAARRQLAAALDEFWGQLFDFHGHATEEAKNKKLDALLGLELKVGPKPVSAFPKVDSSGKERESCSSINSSLNDSSRHSGQIHMGSSYGIQMGSFSLSSSHMKLLAEYARNSTCNAMESGERRYSSLRLPPSSDSFDVQPASIHGYQIASSLYQVAKERSSDYLNGQIGFAAPKSPSMISSTYRDPLSFAVARKPQKGLSSIPPPGFQNHPVCRNNSLQFERPLYARPAEDVVPTTVNAKKYATMPNISGLSLPHQDSLLSDTGPQLGTPTGYGPRTMHGRSLYSSAYDEFSSKVCRDALHFSSNSLWSRQPFEQFGVADKARFGGEGDGRRRSSATQETASAVDLETTLLRSFRHCILKLSKLDGSDWLFRQNDGADEDLIDCVAAREKFLYEAETRGINWVALMGDATDTKLPVHSVPRCGEGCIWRLDLIISFGVWCIHRVLELSLMESRPELWGKYTYVLNRLQGIIDVAFSKPRVPKTPCFCLQIPTARQERSSPPISNGSLPPPAKQGRGKCTTAAMLLDIIKDVETAISSRKGRTGTAAGDVAFPKGKENLASVLKRYKRHLSNKTSGSPKEG
ncbi:hypothetical protein LguiB_035140 [Lonicera macranthoides]